MEPMVGIEPTAYSFILYRRFIYISGLDCILGVSFCKDLTSLVSRSGALGRRHGLDLLDKSGLLTVIRDSPKDFSFNGQGISPTMELLYH
ncbi:MAG: hypothetical protein HYT40_03475 [Candidatus Sungbacteria bacterium]|uniref:Uncharacterized protein n=1 Tax=Candidatus Sungiibacteriota bacterium TaxID=2750080 RepID=A0A931SC31_9BACT|nr:hypothetical protein [Candidatus Sungbacteria bacterium]